MLIRIYRRPLIEAVRLRRLARGPLRDAWSVEFEAWTRLLHHYGRRSHWVPVAWQRRALGVYVLPRRTPWGVSIERADVDGVPAEWITPAEVDHDRVLLYLHGGGYSLGSIASHRHFVARLARHARMRALVIDYRLAPEHPFPAGLDDARTAWRWLLARGYDPSRAAIAGESAGGGLTLATLLETRDAGEPLPAAAAVLSPWADLTLEADSIATNARYDFVQPGILSTCAARYAQDMDRTHPLLSPALADLHGLPPLLIVAGEAETLVDDARKVHARAREAGVDARLSIYPDMIHAFMIFRVPEAREAITEIAGFLRTQTSRAQTQTSEVSQA